MEVDIDKRLNLRIARTLLASNMVTNRAFLRLPNEQRPTQMAVSTNSLHGGSPDQILSTGTRWDRERRVGGGFCSPTSLSFLRGGSSFSFSPRLLLLGSLSDWIAGALLAAGVLAVLADLVCTEGGLATMTVTTNPHADWLFHSLGIPIVTWL